MYKNKSVDILKAIIKICYILLAAVAFAMLFITTGTITWDGDSFKLIEEFQVRLLSFPFYAVVPAGYAALVCIDKLLTNIKKDLVFEAETLKYLNIISYACVYASVVGIVSVVISLISDVYDFIIVFSLLSLGELFMAIVLQVIKQVFKKAIDIKEENELTI